jgi:peptidoglycan/xylan/chitin deacetylase (PgdA/CDA1 family)
MITETSIVGDMLKDLTKKLLYASGLLGLYHRIRNSGSLTVVMFHRTLPPEDPRWSTCDPDYTLSTQWLDRSLRFFKRHYNVVSLDQVLESRRSATPLPRRALLITFDDGWSDNVDHALPSLRGHGLPAVMFVVADAIGATQPFFQERLIGAWRRRVVSVADLVAALRARGVQQALPADAGMGGLREVIHSIERLPVAERQDLLAPFSPALDDGMRHMVDVEDLRKLEAGGVALGLHGKTHAPLTMVADIESELGGARRALAAIMQREQPQACSMSFPHGAHDPDIAERAHDSGYELVFTSVPVLNPLTPEVGWLLGRTGYETDSVVDAKGRFRPEWLAIYLFRRPSRRLA